MHDMRQDAGDAADPPRLLTPKDVQGLIRVDRSTIYRMAESGRLPAMKVGRQWRFPEDRLQEWLRSGLPDGAATDAPLRELVAPDVVHGLADVIGDLLGVMVLVTDMAGHPLGPAGHPCLLFSAVHAHPGVVERCVEGWRNMAAEPDLEPRWRPTPLGFLCARSLVRVGDHLKGMVLAGGVAPADWPPQDSALAALAAGLGVPSALLASHVAGVYHLSLGEQERVLGLLPRVAALMSRLAADNRLSGSRAGGAAPESSAPAQRSIQ